jgi:GNAT superfamily N-acetyltransferase
LADAWIAEREGHALAYGAVANQYGKGRLIAFATLPGERRHSGELCRAILRASGATHVEAQSNMPLMLVLLYDHAAAIRAENYLFADGPVTSLPLPPNGGRLRERSPGDWVVEAETGEWIARGGILTHYNPPFGDLFFEVAEGWRRQGYGSWFAQELKRLCHAGGLTPAARCDAKNQASRRTLEKAGMFAVGRLLCGRVRSGESL